MSRSGYMEGGCDSQEEQWALIRWRGAVNSAMTGKRGQQLLIELRDGMDAMAEKKLIADHIEKDGCFCALGVVGKNRGMDLSSINPHEAGQVSSAFNIAQAMAREIVYMNDEHWDLETDEERWLRVRGWVQHNIMEK